MDSHLNAFHAPFVWGRADCCLVVADCLAGMGLPDPMERYRGRYDSERGARRMFAPEGGLEGAMAARMAECGYVESGDGFVGLVRTGLGPTACLKVGGWWFAKSPDGAFGYEPALVYRQWSHPCLQPSQSS